MPGAPRSPCAGRRRLTWRARRRAAGASVANNILTTPLGSVRNGKTRRMSISSALIRIRLAIARALIGQVNDGGGLQTLQIGIQADVGRDQVERFQQYGVTSVPHAGAECVTLSVGGNTDHPVVINVDDRRYRMRGLKTGEMAIYDDQGMSVHLTRGGIVIRGAGKPMRLTDTSGIELDSEVHVTRGLRVDGNLNLLGSRATHNGSDIGHQHKHGGVQEGNGISGTPVA